MVLPAIAASRVQEDDFLISLARLLVKDFTLSPKRRRNIDITADDTVFVQLLLFVFGSRASKGIMQELQDTAPDVRPASERVLERSRQPVLTAFEAYS